MTYVTVITKKCMQCGEQGTMTVWDDDYQRYLNGANIQDAFSDLLAPAREQILSGTHPQCWEEIFRDIEDDE